MLDEESNSFARQRQIGCDLPPVDQIMETLNWQSAKEKSAAKWDAVFRGINQGHGEPLQNFIIRITNISMDPISRITSEEPYE